MADIIRIPFNDVFFYGVSMRSREDSSVESDIFANIIMRYLRTLVPVSNRLYRVADGDKYEYSYSFIPTRNLSWRVIKNKRIIEDIEQLSDKKYCLSYFDDQGRDVKRVIFDKDHKWLKTNYYNSIYGNTLLSSILPKELNGETVIIQYLTGATYPTTHYCCNKASCKAVEEKVLLRAPLPEISALTNYGVLYFATEETLKIYNQVLKEEEEKYAEAHKPPVYTTDEDIASGFCFTKESFDSQGSNVFSLDEASELTDNDFITSENSVSVISYEESDLSSEVAEVPEHLGISDVQDKPFNIDDDISAVLEIIKNTTNVEIDSSMVFTDPENTATAQDLEKVFEDAEKALEEDASSDMEESSDEVDTDTVAQSAYDDLSDALVADINNSIDTEKEEVNDFVIELNTEEKEDEIASQIDNSDVDLLNMEDEEIDDYVKTLIDSLLTSAKSASGEYVNTSDEGFETENEAPSEEEQLIEASKQESLEASDAVIESGSESYYFFGEYSKETGRNGRGRTLMSDGKTAYEGEYKSDMRHGVGAFYYRNGDLCYYGNWSENKRSGFGVGINSDTGISHVGTWADNKPEGIGVRFDKFGKFLYLDSHCERVNGGIRITGFTEKSLFVEYWDEATLMFVKKEIFIKESDK